MSIYGDIKVKPSLYRPGQALGIAEGCSFQISGLLAYEDGKVVSPVH